MVQKYINMKTYILNKIETEIIKIIKMLDMDIDIADIKIERPADFVNGDYSTNIALIAAKKNQTNPQILAKNIKNKMDEFSDKTGLFEKIEIAGPGFINFYIKQEVLVKEAEKNNFETEFRLYLSTFGEGKTMMIDYSAPNIAKPFGIGHLRSTNIGQAIYNLYKTLGWNCIGDNHIGDWGTQFGKLMVAIKKWNKKNIENLTIEELEKLYVLFHKESETNPELIEEGRNWFAKLENGDIEAREMWQACIDISFKEYNKVYDLLNVKIDLVHGESFYEKMLPNVIKEIEEKGIAKLSEGATIIEFEKMTPAMIRKTNRTTTYFTRDMATVKYRKEKYNPDLVIYEVGVDQKLHFEQLFETARMMNWEPKYGFMHVAHGLVRWPSGKFSTRKGDTIHLEDVIDKALEKAKDIANKSTVSKELKPEEKQDMINSVAIGAIKFSDLSQDPKKDIIFDWDRIMSLDGDSGPYLQYTYARCQSVLHKTKIKEQKDIETDGLILNTEEIALIRELSKFDEKILEATNRFSPSVIAEYLLGVARKYNEFYAKHRIIDQKEEDQRIFITKTTSNVLKFGLKILGINPIERM